MYRAIILIGILFLTSSAIAPSYPCSIDLPAGERISCSKEVSAVVRPAGSVRTDTIKMRGMRFSPKIIEIAAGDTVLWVNDSNNWHNAELEDGSYATPLIKKGETVRRRFDKPGIYKYYCQPHKFMGMKGTIIVR
jgi:plastocyanin